MDITPMKKTIHKRPKSLEIKLSEVSLTLENVLESRINELKSFQLASLNATHSPILSTALAKKTRLYLETIKSCEKKTLKPLKRFRHRAKIVQIVCSIMLTFKRFSVLGMNTRQNQNYFGWKSPTDYTGAHKTDPTNNEILKLPFKLRDCLKTPPSKRDDIDIIKIKYFLRRYQLNTLFPKEKEHFVAKYMHYNCYESNRVIFLQDRPAIRFYFILSGTLFKVKNTKFGNEFNLDEKTELQAGSITCINETVEASCRTYSLICKTKIETLYLERYDVVFIKESCLSIGRNLLRGMSLLSTYPIRKLFKEVNATEVNFFPKGTIINNDINESDFIYVVQSGTCGILHKRAERYIKTGFVTTKSAPLLGRRKHVNDTRIERSAVERRKTKSIHDDMVLAVLGKGNIYGLHTILSKAVNIMKSITNDEKLLSYDRFHPNTYLDTVLVSNGAECLLLRKDAFLKHADISTLSKLLLSPLNVAPTRSRLGSQRNDNYWRSLTMLEVISR